MNQMNMKSIYFNNKRSNEVTRLLVGPDNILDKEYFNDTFPGATGTKFFDKDHDCYIRCVIKTLMMEKIFSRIFPNALVFQEKTAISNLTGTQVCCMI